MQFTRPWKLTYLLTYHIKSHRSEKERLTCYFAVTLFSLEKTKIKSFLICVFCLTLVHVVLGGEHVGLFLFLFFTDKSSDTVRKISSLFVLFSYFLSFFTVRTCCSHIRKLPKCDRWTGSVGMTSDSCYSHSPASYSSQFSGIQTSLGLSGSSAAALGTSRPGGPGLRPGWGTMRSASLGGDGGPPAQSLGSRGSGRMRWSWLSNLATFRPRWCSAPSGSTCPQRTSSWLACYNDRLRWR